MYWGDWQALQDVFEQLRQAGWRSLHCMQVELLSRKGEEQLRQVVELQVWQLGAKMEQEKQAVPLGESGKVQFKQVVFVH